MTEEKKLAEKEKETKILIDDENAGVIQIADDVIASIVGLAVTEVDGVSKLAGGITKEAVAKTSKRGLSKGVSAVINEGKVTLKNMETGEQQMVTPDELIERLSK